MSTIRKAFNAISQPRARGGRGARAEKIQEQIGSAPRTRG